MLITMLHTPTEEDIIEDIIEKGECILFAELFMEEDTEDTEDTEDIIWDTIEDIEEDTEIATIYQELYGTTDSEHATLS